MKTATFLAMTFAAFTSIPLMAQPANANANAQENVSASAAGKQASASAGAGDAASAGAEGVQSDNPAKTTYASNSGGFGDQAASHAWEMSSINAELEGKLDSKTAKVGDRVVLRTTEKVQTASGTILPRGTRLVGHVTEVQAYDKVRGFAQMGIAFDRAELKSGQSIAIHTLIRGVTPAANAAAMNSMGADDTMAMGGMGSGRMGGGAVGDSRNGGLIGGAGSAVNGVGGTVNGAGNMAGGPIDRTGSAIDRTADTTGSMAGRAGADLGSATNTAVNSTAEGSVQTTGHGDRNLNTGAHAASAARAVPHPTRIPGVMLAGSSTASGVLTASRKNIQFESGTQLQLGIVADE